MTTRPGKMKIKIPTGQEPFSRTINNLKVQRSYGKYVVKTPHKVILETFETAIEAIIYAKSILDFTSKRKIRKDTPK